MKNKLLFLSIVLMGAGFWVNASDVITGDNLAQNPDELVTSTSQTSLISAENNQSTIIEKQTIEFSKINDYSQKIKNAYQKELLITGEELKENKENLGKLIDKNPDLLVTLDVSSGGFIKNVELDLTCDRVEWWGLKPGDLPTNIRHLKIIGADDVTHIGDNFLIGHKLLISIDLSGLSNVNKVGNFFLFDCVNIKQIDLSPLANVTEIGSTFLYCCTSLTSIDLSPLANVIEIGNNFISSCKHIKSIDLSPLANVKRIGKSFLSGTALISIDLSKEKHFSNEFINKFVEFIVRNNKIEELILPDFGENPSHDIINKVIKPISKTFRESNNQYLQKIGTQLYIKYIYKPDPNLQKALARLDVEKLKQIAPKTLEDLPEIKSNDIINFFKDIMGQLDDIKNWVDGEGDKENIQLIIEKLFLNRNVKTGFGYLEDNENSQQIKIGLKHFVKNAANLSVDDKKSYTYNLVLGFRNCQSLQGMELNNVLTALGVFNNVIGSETEKLIYKLINEIKMDTFYNMLSGETGVHKVARAFTVLKDYFGLPAAINFNERISKITDADVQNIMSEYIAFFNAKSIVEMFLEKLKTQKISNYSLRAKMLESLNDIDGVDITTKLNYIRGEENFFDVNDYKSFEKSLNENEVCFLLEKMSIIKTGYMNQVRGVLNKPITTTQCTSTSSSN